MPNWLREEIIKTKAAISSTSLGHAKVEYQSTEDEEADKSFQKGDLGDDKSIDTSRSTEEDDDDEVHSKSPIFPFLIVISRGGERGTLSKYFNMTLHILFSCMNVHFSTW